LVTWLEHFADGLKAACISLAPGCGVVGGDLASSDQVMISVAAHGSLEGREPVLRSGAQIGDVVAVAGTLGRAAAGLALLASGNRDAISAYDELVNIQRRPNPPIRAGVEAAIAGATSMLDLSDGLARDSARIAKASDVTIQIDPMNLQGFEAVLEEAARAIDANPSDWVIGGGEDHSLLATFPAGSTLPRAFKPIGVVLPKGPAPVMLGAQPLPERGWDSSRAASN
ncbi:MAG: hypothetical protein RJA66_287, partial [Actinomycetota bacterium]